MSGFLRREGVLVPSDAQAGLELNAYKCVCGAEKTTEGTAIRGR